MAKRAKDGKKKEIIILAIALGVLIIIAGVLVALGVFNERGQEEIEEQEEVVQEVKKVQIVDMDSKTRPYAVMINNNHAAWPQCGLKDAYIVYEIIVEGGITRMMAVYKDKFPEQVGSVRSARHYFIDYAEENDAIFVHWGGSPQAYSRISTGINDVDGMSVGEPNFFRDYSLNRDLEHKAFANLKEVNEYAKKQGYTRDTNKDLLLNYSADEIDLKENDSSEKADEVRIVYSDYQTTSYEYDAENKVYKRYMSGKANVDLKTSEQYTAKNIIAYKVSNYSLDDYGRQELNNIGSGTGYFISNGYAVPIKWEKTSHSEQTVYSYENGEEITVNDGTTFIQIVPTNGSITITGTEVPETAE